MKTNKKRYLAALICILFLVVALASFFYIAKEANHKCTGEDCPICACVHQVEQNLKNLGTGFAAGMSQKSMSAFWLYCYTEDVERKKRRS